MSKQISGLSLFRWAASIRLYVYLSIIITLALIAGTLIPQGAPEPGSRHGVSIIVSLLQPRDLYHSWWFVTLLCLLAVNILCCTLERFSLRRDRIGAELAHLGLVIVLIGGAITVAFGQRGTLALRSGQSSDFFENNGNQPLGFTLKLDKFELETSPSEEQSVVVCKVGGGCRRFPLALNKDFAVDGLPYSLRVLSFFPDLKVDPDHQQVFNASAEPNNPAIQVRIRGAALDETTWLFAKFPDMHLNPRIPADIRLGFEFGRGEGRITDFASTLSVIEAGQPVLTKTIRVNDPLRYGGFSFYQAQYNPEDPNWTGLEVVRDPGVPFVNVGFCMLLAGLLTAFYIVPYMNSKEKRG